jgi:hypothetical protein
VAYLRCHYAAFAEVAIMNIVQSTTRSDVFIIVEMRGIGYVFLISVEPF